MAEMANKQRKSNIQLVSLQKKNQNSAGKGVMCSKIQLLNTTIPQKTFTEIKDQHIHTERVPGYQSKSKINFNGEKTNKQTPFLVPPGKKTRELASDSSKQHRKPKQQ